MLHNGAGVKGAAGDSPRAQGCSQLRRNTEAAEAGWADLIPELIVLDLLWGTSADLLGHRLSLLASLEVIPRSSPLRDRK